MVWKLMRLWGAAAVNSAGTEDALNKKSVGWARNGSVHVYDTACWFFGCSGLHLLNFRSFQSHMIVELFWLLVLGGSCSIKGNNMGHDHGPKIPPYTTYDNYREIPQLRAHEERLARIGLKDPWIRFRRVIYVSPLIILDADDF
uniref:Uncharacterized protein n=1 Tax=Setaria digitata TaxID=48799 RepID=A0A915PD66_9BILA